MVRNPRLQPSAAGAENQQGELDSVVAQRLAEALEDLALTGQDQPGTPGRHAGPADLLRDGGPLLPELDQGVVDVVDAGTQRADVRGRRVRTCSGRGVGVRVRGDGGHVRPISGRGALWSPGTQKPRAREPGALVGL